MVEKKKKAIIDLEDLPGIGPMTAAKLKESGYTEFAAIASSSPHELAEAGEFGVEAAKKVIESAKEGIDASFETADLVYERRKNIGKITTGSKNFDELIGGGVETMAITECYGRFASGKSQVGFQLCINVQKPKDQGGLDGNVLFIDTEQTFRPERLVQMAESQGMNPDQVLKNIFITRAEGSDHQMVLIDKADELIEKNNIKLVIVDSLTSQFRADYVGRGALGERQQKLNKHIHALQKLSEKFNLAVYITNQVMDDPGILFGDPTRPIGGHVLAHACLTGDTLVQLSNGAIKEIKDLSIHDNIISINKDYKNTKASLTAKVVKDKINEVYEIDTGYTITASPKHKFFKIDNFEIKEVRAEDINEGDWMLRSSKIDFEGEEQSLPVVETTFDNEDIGILTPEGAELIRNKLLKKGFRRTDICQNLSINKRQFRRVLNQQYPTTISNFNQLAYEIEDDELFDHVTPAYTNKRRKITIPTVLDVNFAQSLGYMIGDGNLDKHSVRMRDERLDILQEYKSIFKQLFDLDGSITKIKDKNCHELKINSADVRELFEKTQNNLFDLISRSPNEHVKAFIKGFADAEGYVSKTRPTIQIAQKNLKVLKFIQLLLLRFGIRSFIRKAKRCSNLLIHSKELTKYAKEIGLTAKDKSKLLDKWTKYNEATYKVDQIPISRHLVREILEKHNILFSKFMRPRPKSYRYINKKEANSIIAFFEEKKIKSKEIEFMKALLEGDIGFEQVKKIKRKPNTEVLYDITVPKHENFIANGIITHNSTYRLYLRKSKDQKRIARLVDSPNLPEGEAVFKVTSEGIGD